MKINVKLWIWRIIPKINPALSFLKNKKNQQILVYAPINIYYSADVKMKDDRLIISG